MSVAPFLPCKPKACSTLTSLVRAPPSRFYKNGDPLDCYTEIALPALPFETLPLELKRRMEAGERLRLIDVREPQEHAVASISGAELIPMGTVPARLTHLEAQADADVLIVFCHHGVRSLQVVN